MNILILLALGALGTLLRCILSEFFDGKNFPLGILIANIFACSTASAILMFFPLDAQTRLMIAGFAASLSTFSSMNYNIFEMLTKRFYKKAAIYFLLTCSGIPIIFVAII